MEVNYETLIHIETIGYFKEAETWNGLARYDKIDRDNIWHDEFFICMKDNNALVTKILNLPNNMVVIMATNSLLEKFRELDIKDIK